MSYGILWMPTPLGLLRLEAEAGALTSIGFCPAGSGAGPARPAPVLEQARCQLEEYFAGQRQSFSLPLRAGGTPFQQAVWAELCRIPYGQTRSYGQLAAALGRPGAARAVGGACHRNPLAIVVPCHRVIGSNGGLTGYAGGLAFKQGLLALEGAL